MIDGLSAPQPDLIEGLEEEAYRPFPIDRHIPGAVLYEDNPHSVTLPLISGEWKGPEGSMLEAKLQAVYAGAAMVYGISQALNTAKIPQVPGRATVTTFTTGSYKAYKEGRKYLRNAQDLAREKPIALKDELKEYWRNERHALTAPSLRP